MPDLTDYSKNAMDLLLAYGPKLLLAIATLVIGLWVIKAIGKVLARALDKSDIDLSLRRFLKSLMAILLKAMLIISVISMLGVETTSFVALLGAAGLAVGLALQGSLANFAGGVLILLFKPFKVGDTIEAQGYVGSVFAIQIFNTVLKTGDNKRIIIPNGPLSNGSVINISAEPTRRVDMAFGIGYEDDIRQAKTVLRALIDADERIHKDPEPLVVVKELADSSVNFAVRVWCQTSDYWGVFFDMQEKVKLEFDSKDISIPYPQTDVHIHQSAGQQAD